MFALQTVTLSPALRELSQRESLVCELQNSEKTAAEKLYMRVVVFIYYLLSII